MVGFFLVAGRSAIAGRWKSESIVEEQNCVATRVRSKLESWLSRLCRTDFQSVTLKHRRTGSPSYSKN
jgi:hypothetical protein